MVVGVARSACKVDLSRLDSRMLHSAVDIYEDSQETTTSQNQLAEEGILRRWHMKLEAFSTIKKHYP